MKQYIGIDVSKKKIDVMWLKDPVTGKGKSKVLGNDREGHRELIAWIEKHIDVGFNAIHIIIESTSIYHEALAYYLHHAGLLVSVVNPCKSKHFAQSLTQTHKTDKKDSMILAKYGAALNPSLWVPEAAEIRKLKALLNRLHALKDDLQRERNRLEKIHRHEPEQSVLESSSRMITSLEEEIARVSQEINDHIDRHPPLRQDKELLKTIPGIGEVSSILMLSVIRGRDFNNARQLASYLGLSPKQHESGEKAGRTTLSKGGSSKIRAKLYMAAIVAAQQNPHLKGFYQRLLTNGKAKKQAICAVMRKLAQICFGVLKHQSEYQPPAFAG